MLYLTVTLLLASSLTVMSSCSMINLIPPASAEMTKDNTVAEMISKMNMTEIYNTVFSLQNFITRKYGTPGNLATATYLFNRLSNISGLSVEYQSNYRNVIATLPGVDTASNATYIVGAHYDSTSLLFAPGATDNAGGVAIVLELARIMSQYSFNHTLKFAFWNFEEGGSYGSKEYVSYARANNLNVSLYLNYDSSCYDPDNHFVLDIMYNAQSRWVSDMMTTHNTLYGINFTLNYNVHDCSGDHRSFWDYGYTAVMTHSEEHGPAHTYADTIDEVSTAYAKRNGQLGMSVLASLAEAIPPAIPEFSPAHMLFMLVALPSAVFLLLRKNKSLKGKAFSKAYVFSHDF